MERFCAQVLWQWLLNTLWTNPWYADSGWSSFPLDCVHSGESISFMLPRQAAYSSVSCHSLSSCDLDLLSLMYSWISEAVSMLLVVFCNDIHIHNLENKLFTLKAVYVTMCLNPSTILSTACVQLPDDWLVTHGIVTLRHLFQNHTFSQWKIEENS